MGSEMCIRDRRGPNVPSYVVAANAPLLFLPLRSGPQKQVLDWLAAVDGVSRSDLRTKMTQKDLRQWKRKHPGHRSFTVLRHPILRAHDAFCRHILTTGHGSYTQLRNTMMRRYKMPLPPGGPDERYDLVAHRTAFAAFLRFLKGNLSGQTAVRVDAAWCTQAQSLLGFGELTLPDRIFREDDLATGLNALGEEVGCQNLPTLSEAEPSQPFGLADIYDDEIEKLGSDAYMRDYVTFGFSRWR